MIRDRLLSFDVRNGSLAGVEKSRRKDQLTINERSQALK